MTQEQHAWIEVPVLLDTNELGPTQAALVEAGVPHETEPVATGADPTGETQSHVLRVAADHVEAAAFILRELYVLADPLEDVPFTGDCPACSTVMVDAWSCPECGITCRSPYDAADPFIVFIRENGGFRDHDRMALQELEEGGCDMSRPMPIDFLVATPDEAAAKQVADAAGVAGYETEISQDEDEDLWVCACTKTMLATHEGILAALEEFDSIADPFEGYACGWTTDGNAD